MKNFLLIPIMLPSVLFKSVWISLGFLLILCNAQDDYPYPIQNNLLYNRMELDDSKPVLQCYDCNSEYDPRCGDKFNPYTIGVVNCTDRNTPEHLVDPLDPDKKLQPILCRKMVQKVQGKVRVIRGCGYIRDAHDDKKCYRRTGTKDVEVIHCSCTTSLCNAAHVEKVPSRLLFALLPLILVSFKFFSRFSI